MLIPKASHIFRALGQSFRALNVRLGAPGNVQVCPSCSGHPCQHTDAGSFSADILYCQICDHKWDIYPKLGDLIVWAPYGSDKSEINNWGMIFNGKFWKQQPMEND